MMHKLLFLNLFLLSASCPEEHQNYSKYDLIIEYLSNANAWNNGSEITQFKVYPKLVYQRVSNFNSIIDKANGGSNSRDSLSRIDDEIFKKYRKEFIKTGEIVLSDIDYSIEPDRVGECCWNISFSQAIDNAIIAEVYKGDDDDFNRKWEDLVQFRETHQFLFVFKDDLTFTSFHNHVIR